jgi:glycosyltransferase involved in cell wall biosynthesis
LKIQAFVPVYQESDILPHTLRHLHEQGCAVHVIDGWSTDGCRAIAESFSGYGVTSERFPADGPSPTQDCGAILKRIEDLAAESDADWILYSDADEWRRCFQPLMTLADGVFMVDSMGYNAVDFRVFQFYCVEPFGWRGGDCENPESYHRYFDETDCISRIPNRKLWKNVGRVQLAGGGHEVQFPGMRIYPVQFSMKHYPFRTPAQAKAKIETRIKRRNHQEHAAGWGVHYDQYPPGFEFCWDPAKLRFWKDTRSPLP